MNIATNIAYNISFSLSGGVALDSFVRNVLTDNGTADRQLLTQGFNSMKAKYRNKANMLLIPGAYKAGKIYAMHPVTGAIVPFTFSRPGIATYFGKDGLLKFASANEPRLDYDPLTGECLGYCIEPQVLNVIPNSNNFTGWGGQSVVKTPESGVSPSGANNATSISTVNSEGANREFIVRVTPTITLSGTETYTISVFAKRGNYRYIGVRVCGNSTVPTFDFDTETWTALENINGNNYTAKHQKLKNGWYRLSVTRTVISTEGSFFDICLPLPTGVLSRTSSGGEYVLIYGAQLEKKRFSTSYIPASGSQTVRLADLIISESAGLYVEQNTAYIEGSTKQGPGGGENNLTLLGGSLSNGSQIGTASAETMYGTWPGTGTSPKLVLTGGRTPATMNKVAVAWNSAPGKVRLASAPDITPNEQDVTPGAYSFETSKMIVGARGSANGLSNNYWICGHVQAVMNIPEYLSADDLLELTT